MSRDPCPTASGKARPISDRLWSISMRADASARCLGNLNRAIADWGASLDRLCACFVHHVRGIAEFLKCGFAIFREKESCRGRRPEP